MLIIDMPMPKCCAECPLSCQMYSDTPCWCKAAFEENEAVEGGLMWKETDPTTRPSWCPIKGVLPDEHGDLIDRDAISMPYDICDGHEAMEFVNETPVIIAAERKDDEQIH